ncbi:hypothetical protein J4E81_000589 [Alternaria sp. BMP 2799]|nr:hypothetical protein J4E81_000589 [Alternaria sp. BMP 2799]
MQRKLDRLSVGIIPEQSLDITDTSLHWLFGKDGGYVTRLNDDYAQDTPNDSIPSAKSEARITREIGDWMQSQECDEFWAPRAQQPRRQRKERRFVTALRSHSHHRYSPAAGHQARPPSETESWPGLYTGPSTEEKLAQYVSQRRKIRKQSSDYIPHFTASGWTDGPPAITTREDSRSPLSRESSSSSSEPGFFSKLICQAAVPKNYRRRHDTIFFSRTTSKQKKQERTQFEDKSDNRAERQKISSQPVQRIPSLHRLRHTQSALCIEVEADIEEEIPVESPHDGKRHPSDPSIGSILTYTFQIPEVRRTSVTPNSNWGPASSEEGMMRACGRGDLIVTRDYFDDVPETPDNARHQQSRWKIPHWRHKLGDSPPLPATMSSTQPMITTPAVDYFAQVYTEKHVTHQTDDPEVAAEEHSDAGPEIEDDPRLRKMLGNIVTPSSDDESSDSDMERTKKRKGIKESDTTAFEVAERFRDKTGDGWEHTRVKALW